VIMCPNQVSNMEAADSVSNGDNRGGVLFILTAVSAKLLEVHNKDGCVVQGSTNARGALCCPRINKHQGRLGIGRVSSDGQYHSR
jgi:hypothetical protein